MTDKNGAELQIGDYVIINSDRYGLICGRVYTMDRASGSVAISSNIIYCHIYCEYVEKIPLDEKEREQLIFLRSLEQ